MRLPRRVLPVAQRFPRSLVRSVPGHQRHHDLTCRVLPICRAPIALGVLTFSCLVALRGAVAVSSITHPGDECGIHYGTNKLRHAVYWCWWKSLLTQRLSRPVTSSSVRRSTGDVSVPTASNTATIGAGVVTLSRSHQRHSTRLRLRATWLSWDANVNLSSNTLSR